ncbi:hypothetical protein H7142_01840 [Candidatus Saccharibacteria bacterium]|nr:hypothetical protein [Candidatus Saccharibacteria bacterium]
MKYKNLAIGFAAFATAVSMNSGVALANPGAMGHGHTYQANLTALNKTDDRGNSTAAITSDGNGKYTVKVTGASANLAHAQHIHVGGTNTCPDPSADKDKDGFINTSEGEPFYGPIEISLTTSGDTSKDSGLAVDRFPMADAKGNVTYERSFALPAGVTEDMLAKGVVVQHGASELFNDKTKYDGTKKSDIPGSEALPLEATIPSSCGKLQSMPVGGAGTGDGGASEVVNTTSYAIGGTALLAAGALYLARRKSQMNL